MNDSIVDKKSMFNFDKQLQEQRLKMENQDQDIDKLKNSQAEDEQLLQE